MPKVTNEILMKEVTKIEKELDRLIAINNRVKNRIIGVEVWCSITFVVLSLFFVCYLYF